MSVIDLTSREERPAYVSFERVPVEDIEASRREGRYVAKDVDYVNVTPAYSKDIYRAKVDQWLTQVERDVAAERTPARWLELWREAYQRWREGQEIPLNGTPIKGWALISPAQQEMLIRMNCRTVEDLAGASGEGLQRIGIGALDLKNKAVAWLQAARDHGPLALKAADLERQNAGLQAQVSTLTEQVEALMGQMRAMAATTPSVPEERIEAVDILPEPEVPKRRRHA